MKLLNFVYFCESFLPSRIRIRIRTHWPDWIRIQSGSGSETLPILVLYKQRGAGPQQCSNKTRMSAALFLILLSGACCQRTSTGRSTTSCTWTVCPDATCSSSSPTCTAERSPSVRSGISCPDPSFNNPIWDLQQALLSLTKVVFLTVSRVRIWNPVVFFTPRSGIRDGSEIKIRDPVPGWTSRIIFLSA